MLVDYLLQSQTNDATGSTAFPESNTASTDQAGAAAASSTNNN